MALLLLAAPAAGQSSFESDPFASRFRERPNLDIRFRAPEAGGVIKVSVSDGKGGRQSLLSESVYEVQAPKGGVVTLEYQDIRLTADYVRADSEDEARRGRGRRRSRAGAFPPDGPAPRARPHRQDRRPHGRAGRARRDLRPRRHPREVGGADLRDPRRRRHRLRGGRPGVEVRGEGRCRHARRLREAQVGRLPPRRHPAPLHALPPLARAPRPRLGLPHPGHRLQQQPGRLAGSVVLPGPGEVGRRDDHDRPLHEEVLRLRHRAAAEAERGDELRGHVLHRHRPQPAVAVEDGRYHRGRRPRSEDPGRRELGELLRHHVLPDLRPRLRPHLDPDGGAEGLRHPLRGSRRLQPPPREGDGALRLDRSRPGEEAGPRGAPQADGALRQRGLRRGADLGRLPPVDPATGPAFGGLRAPRPLPEGLGPPLARSLALAQRRGGLPVHPVRGVGRDRRTLSRGRAPTRGSRRWPASSSWDPPSRASST